MKELEEQNEYQIAQIVATVAIEDMPIDSQTYENLTQIATREKTAEQIISMQKSVEIKGNPRGRTVWIAVPPLGFFVSHSMRKQIHGSKCRGRVDKMDNGVGCVDIRKAHIHIIEKDNINTRHHFGHFTRRTKIVSKSEDIG